MQRQEGETRVSPSFFCYNKSSPFPSQLSKTFLQESMKKQFALGASAFLLMFALTRCGQQVCSLGMGDCASMFKLIPKPAATPSPSSPLTLQIAGPKMVSVVAPVTYTASGGNGTYTFSVVSPFGCGQFSGHGQFTPLSTGNCTIQVVDTSNPPLSASTTIQIY